LPHAFAELAEDADEPDGAALEDVALLTLLPQAASSRLDAARAVARMADVLRAFFMCGPFDWSVDFSDPRLHFPE
jgi:hypothetical protein